MRTTYEQLLPPSEGGSSLLEKMPLVGLVIGSIKAHRQRHLIGEVAGAFELALTPPEEGRAVLPPKTLRSIGRLASSRPL